MDIKDLLILLAFLVFINYCNIDIVNIINNIVEVVKNLRYLPKILLILFVIILIPYSIKYVYNKTKKNGINGIKEDLTNNSLINGYMDYHRYGSQPDKILEKMKKIINTGTERTRRSVSAVAKKYVAAEQEWKCGHCNQMLDATYEVDHILPLYKGGTNHYTNLQALCRGCHGKKTIQDALNIQSKVNNII